MRSTLLVFTLSASPPPPLSLSLSLAQSPSLALSLSLSLPLLSAHGCFWHAPPGASNLVIVYASGRTSGQ